MRAIGRPTSEFKAPRGASGGAERVIPLHLRCISRLTNGRFPGLNLNTHQSIPNAVLHVLALLKNGFSIGGH